MRIFLGVILFISLALTRQANAVVADTTAIHNLITQASEYERTADYEREIELARKAYVLSQSITYSKGVSAACMRIGSAYLNSGLTDSALFYFRQAYTIREKLKNTKDVTSTCIALCYAFRSIASYDSAYAVLYNALHLNQLAKDRVGITQTYIELGNLSIENNDLPQAEKYLLEADKIAGTLDSKEISIQSSSALGNYFYNKKENKKALYYFLKVNKLANNEHVKMIYASNLNNIGLCYSALGLFNEATVSFQKGLAVYVELGMRYDEGNTCFNLGNMYNDMKLPDKAIPYFKRSLAISREIDDKRHILLGYEYLADAYVLKGDFKEAYHYQLLSNQLNDSILNSDKMNSIIEMQTKYETDLKSSEIKILQGANDIARLKASRSLGMNFGLGGALLGIICVAFAFYSQSKKKQKLNNELFIEKKKSDDLLLNILPAEIAEELKQSGVAKAKQYNHVTVLFTDFVNFTGVSMSMSPTELVEEINRNFTAFDAIIEKHGLEKIKTIGDAYLAVCGLPHETADHAERVTKAALEIQHYMNGHHGKFKVRIGIHTGSVVAGIVGVKKYAYDIWGDTVNTAARMEQHSEAGRINISGATFELIKNEFACEHRGKIQAKNKGEVDMYFVNRSFGEG